VWASAPYTVQHVTSIFSTISVPCVFLLAGTLPLPADVLSDEGEDIRTPINSPVSGNLLDNAVVPPGTTATVDSFTVEGVDPPFVPGTGPITLVNPVTGVPTGMLDLLPNGTFTFVPEPGYVGPVPTVTYTVAGSDGQTNPSAINIDVEVPSIVGEAAGRAAGAVGLRGTSIL